MNSCPLSTQVSPFNQWSLQVSFEFLCRERDGTCDFVFPIRPSLCTFVLSNQLRVVIQERDSAIFENSLISSSHLYRGLPTGLLVLMQLSRPEFHSAIFFDHRSSGRSVLIASLHFILGCVSIQQGILVFIIFSSASLVLLLMYSIQSSSSISILSISSSLSF